MMWLRALNIVRRIPETGWWLIIGALVVSTAVLERGAYGDRREREGFAKATQGARFDSTMRATFTRERERVVVRTDTLVKRITVTRHRVDTLIAALPDSVRALPSVQPLVVTVQLLTQQVDSLTLQIDLERAAHTMERSVLEAQNKAAHAVIAVQADSIKQLEKRPTRGTLVKVTGVALGVGAAAKPIVKLIVEVLR